jgi:hypothetical protein
LPTRQPFSCEKVRGPACKPGSVPRVAATVISLGRRLPGGSSDLPEGHDGPDQPCPLIWSCSRWGLPSQPVTRLLVGSYIKEPMVPPPFHPYLIHIRADCPCKQLGYGSGGILSVALSLSFASLRRWPGGRKLGRWALPTTASCGARTFLSPLVRTATVQPAHELSLLL